MTIADGRCKHMADSLDLISEELTVGNPEAVHIGRRSHIEVPVVYVIETAQRIRDLSLMLRIPRLMYLIEIGTVGQVERRTDIQETEEREIGLDRYRVRHAVLPVLTQTGVQQQVFLGENLVLQAPGI